MTSQLPIVTSQQVQVYQRGNSTWTFILKDFLQMMMSIRDKLCLDLSESAMFEVTSSLTDRLS